MAVSGVEMNEDDSEMTRTAVLCLDTLEQVKASRQKSFDVPV